jgi:hypothetical protein
MKRGLFILLSLGVTFIASAQPSAPSGFDANANLANANGSMFRSFDNRYTGVKGHTTVFEDFVYGNVNLKDGERALGQELNYDAVTRELIVRSRIYKRVLAVRRDLVVSFELINSDGDTLVFKKATERDFCQVIHEGNVKMYLKYTKQLIKANYGGAYNPNARTSDEFVDVNVYLISTNGEPLEEIKPQRKAFEKKFPEKKELVKTYFKENKPDLTNVRQMGQFLAYLDKNS